jgi:hypothetical protein
MIAKRLAAAAHSAGPDIPKYAAPRREKDAPSTVADLTGANTISIKLVER